MECGNPKIMYVIRTATGYLTRRKSGAIVSSVADAARWRSIRGAQARVRVSGGKIVGLGDGQ